MKYKIPEVGSLYPNWYNKPAIVLAVFPYTGKYPEWFTHVLRLSAPSTKQGWLEMAADLRVMMPEAA
jgi:hypothetical protein